MLKLKQEAQWTEPVSPNWDSAIELFVYLVQRYQMRRDI